MNIGEPLIQIREVTLSPLPPAQPRPITMMVRAGEFVVIEGGNGLGKSYLLNLMTGLVQPEDGQVFLGKKRSTEMSAKQRSLWRRNLGLITSTNTLLPYYTVRENLVLAACALGVPENSIESRCSEALGLCGLSAMGEALVSSLSSGQIKRALIARALVNRPEVILADDPFNSLDNFFRNGLLKLFSSLPTYGYAVVLTSTDPLPITAGEVTTVKI